MDCSVCCDAMRYQIGRRYSDTYSDGDRNECQAFDATLKTQTQGHEQEGTSTPHRCTAKQTRTESKPTLTESGRDVRNDDSEKDVVEVACAQELPCCEHGVEGITFNIMTKHQHPYRSHSQERADVFRRTSHGIHFFCSQDKTVGTEELVT